MHMNVNFHKFSQVNFELIKSMNNLSTSCIIKLYLEIALYTKMVKSK